MIEEMNSIGVVVTYYNEGDKIFAALESLENQSDKDFQIIIVKDKSSDEDSNNIAIQLKKNYCVIQLEENLGLSGARNTGINHLFVDIIVPLDADDILPVDTILKVRSKFIQHPEVDFVYGDYIINYIENNEKEFRDLSIITNHNNELVIKKLLMNWKLLGTSPFRKPLWDRIGGYSLDFSNTCQDVDFFLRALRVKAKSKYLNDVIYVWNKSDKGMNSNSPAADIYLCFSRNFELFIEHCPEPSIKVEEMVDFLYNQVKNFNEELRYKDNIILKYKNSKSFKIGQLILRPLSFFNFKKINPLFF